MLDWSKTSSIVFVAGFCALFVFLLASVISVAVKGKRKCSAFDVVLRIVSALVFAVSTVMLVCAVLLMLTGSLRIEYAPAALSSASLVRLVLGETTVDLPLPELFEILSSTLAAVMVMGLFVLSLVTLIADCLIANKKDARKKAAKQTLKQLKSKTPEEIKRDAQLEKIRRIGESAVRKTSSAAAGVASSESRENADDKGVENDIDSDEKRSDATDGISMPEIDATGDTVQEYSGNESDTEDAEPFDWRVDSAPESKRTDFVGLSSESDPDFDTFGDIDDGENTPESGERDEREAENVEYASNGSEPADDFVSADEFDGAEYADADADVDERDEVADEPANYSGDYFDRFDAENADTRGEADGDGERYTDETQTTESGDGDEPYASDEYVEPNRNIYIPEIRKIARSQKSAQKPVGGKNTPRRNAANKPTRSAGATAVKAPTAKKSKNSSARVQAKPDVPKNAERRGSKLPVTRRYVILDRTNAVNMFGDYLKERDKADKDKLEASINTINI